jgi:macrolide transport system ATP-binding/permease protein
MSVLSWLRRRRLRLDEDDFEQEIRAHLAMAEDDRIADGVDRQTAHFAALKEFGNVTRTTEAARAVWTPRWLETLRDQVADVRYAVRALAKSPAFSLTVIGVLTLGIGLNAAAFTMLKGIALSPIAGVRRSASLPVMFRETTSGRQLAVSYPDYCYLRDHDRAFSGLFGSAVATVGLGRGRESRPIWAEIVSGNYFQILEVSAERGRVLLPSDESAPGRQPVVVLSDGIWRRDFGSDPDIVGRTIEINNTPLTVVGVADPAFHGTTVVYDVEAFIPVTMAPQLGFRFGSRETTPSAILADHRTSLFFPQGRLRPGTTLASASAQAGALWAGLAGNRAPDEVSERLRVVPFWETPNGAPIYLLPTLTVMSAMALLVLAIACANVAGLVLVRGVSRRGEIAVRLALGATRRRIVRLLVLENLVVAMPGALLGVLLAANGIPLLVGYADALAAPQRLYFNVQVDPLVIGFAVLVACGSALVFGFMPALRSSRVDLVSAINEDASPRGAARSPLRGALVVAQVAVSLLLLVGAGLVTRSLEAARHADPGFDARQVTVVSFDLKQNGYDDAHGRLFVRRLLQAVRADPGTESATLAVYEPLNLLETRAERAAIQGYDPRRGEDLAFLSNRVGPDYFRTLRIPLLAGREFQDGDDERASPVAIVNRTLAQRFWGDAGNAIGRRIRVGDGEWRTVIGVAADIKYLRVNEPPRPYVYLPVLQVYRSDLILHTRGQAPVDVLVDQARRHLASLDPDLPLMHAGPLAERLKGALIFFNLSATMLVVFGVTGMALAAMGTYALVSYTVEQSAREIGIRMALGASGMSVVRRFLGRGLRLGALGGVLGIIAAFAVSRLLQGVLFGVSPTDAVSFARASVIVLGAVAAATIVPAWRAARTDPLKALRHQ